MREAHQPPTTSPAGPPHDHTHGSSSLLPPSAKSDRIQQNPAETRVRAYPNSRAPARTRNSRPIVAALGEQNRAAPRVIPIPHPRHSRTHPRHSHTLPRHSRTHPRHSHTLPRHSRTHPRHSHTHPRHSHTHPRHSHTHPRHSHTHPRHSHTHPRHSHTHPRHSHTHPRHSHTHPRHSHTHPRHSHTHPRHSREGGNLSSLHEFPPVRRGFDVPPGVAVPEPSCQ